MIRVLGFALAAIVHFTVLLILIWPANQKKAPPPSKENVVQVKLIPLTVQSSEIVKSQKTGEGFAIIDPIICEGQNEKYKGIGLVYTFGDQRILQIPEQYPAFKAGLRLKDMILTISNQDDRFDFVDVVVYRNGVELKFHIRKDLICFQKPEPKKEAAHSR